MESKKFKAVGISIGGINIAPLSGEMELKFENSNDSQKPTCPMKNNNEVRCRNCGDLIALIKDVRNGFNITSASLEWKNQVFKNGEKAECKKCGHEWLKDLLTKNI